MNGGRRNRVSENMNKESQAGRESGRPDEPIRRPYKRPGIISREVWEAVAGVCAGAGTKSSRPPCSGPLSS